MDDYMRFYENDGADEDQHQLPPKTKSKPGKLFAFDDKDEVSEDQFQLPPKSKHSKKFDDYDKDYTTDYIKPNAKLNKDEPFQYNPVAFGSPERAPKMESIVQIEFDTPERLKIAKYYQIIKEFKDNKINLDALNILLSRGAFGSVYVTNNKPATDVEVDFSIEKCKVLPKGCYAKKEQSLDDKDYIINSDNEINVLKLLNSQATLDFVLSEVDNNLNIREGFKRICKYFGSINTHDKNIIVLEFCPNVLSKVKEIFPDGLSLERSLKIIKHVLQGLSYMHSLGISHNDIKLDNVGLFEEDRNVYVRILDFGSSAFVYSNGVYQFGTSYLVKKQHAETTKSIADPNLLIDRISTKNDIWSVALLFFNLFVNIKPDPYRFNDDAYIQQIINVDLVGKLATVSNFSAESKTQIVQLIQNMMKLDLYTRYDALQCLRMFPTKA